jgi:alpha-ketoglutarate-dependent taurine dioxygenase
MEEQHDASKRFALQRFSPALGVEVTGFDAGSLDSPALGPFLHRALLDHQLLLLRGVSLDAVSFRRLGAHLGTLRRVPDGMQVEPGLPEVQRLTNLGADGKPTGINPDPYSMQWHTDGSAARIPSSYTLLYALRVPKEGGATGFVDMYAACEGLSPARRRALVGRLAVHEPEIARYFRHGRAIAPADASVPRRLRLRARFVRRVLSSRTARHPIVRIHEETGRECLFIGDHAWRVTGCWWPTGIRLANELNSFATTNPDWTYTHAWRLGDLVIWDNRCLLHRGSDYDAARETRVMLRSVINGESVPIPADGCHRSSGDW